MNCGLPASCNRRSKRYPSNAPSGCPCRTPSSSHVAKRTRSDDRSIASRSFGHLIAGMGQMAAPQHGCRRRLRQRWRVNEAGIVGRLKDRAYFAGRGGDGGLRPPGSGSSPNRTRRTAHRSGSVLRISANRFVANDVIHASSRCEHRSSVPVSNCSSLSTLSDFRCARLARNSLSGSDAGSRATSGSPEG